MRTPIDTPLQQQVIRTVLNSRQVTNSEDDLQTFLSQIGTVVYEGLYSRCEQLEQQNRLVSGLDARHAALGLWCYLNGIVQLSGSAGKCSINLEQDAEKLLNIDIDAVLIKPNA